MKENNNKNMIILLMGVIIIILLVLGTLFATNVITFTNKASTNNQETTNQNIEQESPSNTLTNEEIISIGKKLYDKATEVYETEMLYPYCGFFYKEMANRPQKKYDDIATGTGIYYDSGFKNLDELKEYLKKYFSKDLVDNKIVTDYAIEDLSLLGKEGYAYTNYIIDDGKLYCRSFAGKGWMNAIYLYEYDMIITNIEETKITFTIQSKYISDETYQKIMNNQTECNVDNKDKCSDNDITIKDSTFIIEKSNDNWVVSNFTLHE